MKISKSLKNLFEDWTNIKPTNGKSEINENSRVFNLSCNVSNVYHNLTLIKWNFAL
jgi:hypothetical protein